MLIVHSSGSSDWREVFKLHTSVATTSMQIRILKIGEQCILTILVLDLRLFVITSSYFYSQSEMIIIMEQFLNHGKL